MVDVKPELVDWLGGETVTVHRTASGHLLCPVCAAEWLNSKNAMARDVPFSFETCPECYTQWGFDDQNLPETDTQGLTAPEVWAILRTRWLDQLQWPAWAVQRIEQMFRINLVAPEHLSDAEIRASEQGTPLDCSDATLDFPVRRSVTGKVLCPVCGAAWRGTEHLSSIDAFRSVGACPECKTELAKLVQLITDGDDPQTMSWIHYRANEWAARMAWPQWAVDRVHDMLGVDLDKPD